MATWEIFDTTSSRLIGFDPTWLPSEAYHYVSPQIRTHREHLPEVWLEAKSYVGTIPLLNGDVLYIVPRIGRDTFSRMLLKTEGLDQSIRDEFDEISRIGLQEQENMPLLKLLARPFLEKLRQIEKLSLMPGRERVSSRQNYVKGRVLIAPTLLELSRQTDRPIFSVYKARTYVTLENRTLATAVAALSAIGLIPEAHIKLATRWLEMVEGDFIHPSELRRVSMQLERKKYTGSRQYYISALLMAKVILSQSGIRLGENQEIASEAILTNLPLLFERYVRMVIGDAFTPRGYVVEKITQGARPLFLDGSCRLQPDILISDTRGFRLIADTKYKLGTTIDPSDYYQMYTYLEAFKVDVGLLILPADAFGTPTLMRRDLPIGKHMLELRLPIDAWEDAEALIIETVGNTLATT